MGRADQPEDRKSRRLSRAVRRLRSKLKRDAPKEPTLQRPAGNPSIEARLSRRLSRLSPFKKTPVVAVTRIPDDSKETSVPTAVHSPATSHSQWWLPAQNSPEPGDALQASPVHTKPESVCGDEPVKFRIEDTDFASPSSTDVEAKDSETAPPPGPDSTPNPRKSSGSTSGDSTAGDRKPDKDNQAKAGDGKPDKDNQAKAGDESRSSKPPACLPLAIPNDSPPASADNGEAKEPKDDLSRDEADAPAKAREAAIARHAASMSDSGSKGKGKNVSDHRAPAQADQVKDAPSRKDSKESESDSRGPGAPTHTDSSGRTSYYTPPTPNYTTPGYEWAKSSKYDWESRKKIYGHDNPTLGEAYQQRLLEQEANLEKVHENMKKIREEPVKISYAYYRA